MKLKGIAASSGVACAKVFILETPSFNISNETCEDVLQELTLVKNAVEETVSYLTKLRNDTKERMGEEYATIFDAHIQMATDPELQQQVNRSIQTNKWTAAYAWKHASESFATLFDQMDNEYMKERAADIRDVSKRVISFILKVPLHDPKDIVEEVILVAKDLTPSDTAQLNTTFVKAIVTEIGGKTSHSAIMSRSLEIPAVVGVTGLIEQVKENDLMIVEGHTGEITIDPTSEELEHYEMSKMEYITMKRVWDSYKNKESITLDGLPIEIASNIGNPHDLASAIEHGSDGIGLYRTEFLYMESKSLPSESVQFEAYKKVLEAMNPKKVIIRTLDIGGDKHLPYLQLEEELNPFLGHRALRLCLDRLDLFKVQLRALLRASAYGNLHIMFPMVATLDELRAAKKVVEECKHELLEEGYTDIHNYKIGIMVEIPSVAIMAHQFAKEVDFFSIGTNDLIQYTFAADRMNEKVSYLYQPYHPSILRLVKMVIDASHQEGIWTGMCGEMAGDQIAVPLLLGLGLDEFSMSSNNVPKTRHLISKLSSNNMKKLVEDALKLSTNQEVEQLVHRYLEGVKR